MANRKLKVEDCDDGAALILPADLLAYLGVAVGDTLHAPWTSNGVALSKISPTPDGRGKEAGEAGDSMRN